MIEYLYFYSFSPNWELILSFATLFVAVLAYIQAKDAGLFDKTPNVIASGIFVISINKTINEETINMKRDKVIKKIQTLQLINIGRGYAKSVIPSKDSKPVGSLLEALCPHEFNLPSGKSTFDYNETLRINGGNLKDNSFFIFYKDTDGKEFCTKVDCNRIEYSSIKTELNEDLIKDEKELFNKGKKTEYLELWKISGNNSCNYL